MTGLVGSSGFITIHRAITAWPLYRYLRADQKHVITTLLLLANWKPSVVWIAGRRFEVGRGELIHTETKIAEEAGCSRKVVRTVLDLLLKDGFISEHKVATAGARSVRKITIRNYDRFQSPEDRAGPGTVSQEDTDGTWTEHAGAPSEPSKPREPSKPKRSRASAVPVSDPRHAPLVKRLTDAFMEIRLGKYGFVPRDARDAVDLLLLGEPDEIERRWRVALKHVGFPSVSTLADLKSHWNRFAGIQPGANGVQSMVRAPSPLSEFASKGDQPL